MCVPVSVITGGQIGGCQGICRMWPHISVLIVIFGGLIFNFRSWLFAYKKKLEQGSVQ